MKYIIILVFFVYSNAYSATPAYIEYSQKELNEIIGLKGAESLIGNVYFLDLLAFLGGKTSRTEESIWPYEKEIKGYEITINEWYKSSISRTKTAKKYGFFKRPDEHYKNVLKNTKLHYQSLKSQFKNDVVPKILLNSAQKFVNNYYVNKKDINDKEMISILAQAMVEKPSLFKKRRNFLAKNNITKNVDWLAYETIVDGKTLFYGHALIFRSDLFNKMSAIDPGLHQIEWIGRSSYLPNEKVPSEINKYSITTELAFGANEQEVIDGLVSKFKINKKLVKIESNCSINSTSSNVIVPYGVNKQRRDIATMPFSFILQTSSWAGGDITRKMQQKYPELFKLRKCFDDIKSIDRNTEIQAKLTKSLGLVSLSVRLNKNRLIPKELFIASAKENWGDEYHLNDEYNILTLKYPRLKVSLINDKNTNKSQVIYTMNMDAISEEGDPSSYRIGNYYSIRVLDISESNLMTEIPFELINKAKYIEGYINDISERKGTNTLKEFSL